MTVRPLVAPVPVAVAGAVVAAGLVVAGRVVAPGVVVTVEEPDEPDSAAGVEVAPALDPVCVVVE